MRNLVAARALTHKCGAPAAFVVVYADGSFPMANKVRTKEWDELMRLTEGRAVPFRSVSYQHLHSVAAAASSTPDRPVLDELSAWMGQKYMTVSAQVEP